MCVCESTFPLSLSLSLYVRNIRFALEVGLGLKVLCVLIELSFFPLFRHFPTNRVSEKWMRMECSTHRLI